MENADNNLLVEHKSTLIEYLKNENIEDVFSLWGNTKAYYTKLRILCGGSYASWNDYINVHIAVTTDEHYRFKVTLSELKN